MSQLTLEDARLLVLKAVGDLRQHHPRGVSGAALGNRLRQLGANDFYRAFGSAKLSDFIRAHCSGTLTIWHDDDLMVDLPEGTKDPSSFTDSGTPRPDTHASSIRKAEHLEPRVWKAALFPGQQQTYLHRDTGQVVSRASADNAPNPEVWKRVEPMPHTAQVATVDAVRDMVSRITVDTDLRAVLLAAMEKAKSGERPIADFSSVVNQLLQIARAWNVGRMDAVVEHVRGTTGVDPRGVRSLAPQAVRDTRERPTLGAGSAPSVPSATAASTDRDGLRQTIKALIDEMPLRDLLDLRLPVEYIALFSRGNLRREV